METPFALLFPFLMYNDKQYLYNVHSVNKLKGNIKESKSLSNRTIAKSKAIKTCAFLQISIVTQNF